MADLSNFNTSPHCGDQQTVVCTNLRTERDKVRVVVHGLSIVDLQISHIAAVAVGIVELESLEANLQLILTKRVHRPVALFLVALSVVEVRIERTGESAVETRQIAAAPDALVGSGVVQIVFVVRVVCPHLEREHVSAGEHRVRDFESAKHRDLARIAWRTEAIIRKSKI